MVAQKNLPAELDDIILDHLHDDRDTLTKCAFVRRSWLPTIRYHKWRDLRITCDEKELHELENVFEASPEVVHFVRSVTLIHQEGGPHRWCDLQVLHLALSIISHLPIVSSLILDGLWFGDASRTTKPERDTVLPIIQHLTVRSCTFDSFDMHLISRAFPSLSTLHFDGVWWGRWESGNAPSTQAGRPFPPPPTLKELYLGSCYSRNKIIEWLLDESASSSIETLRLPLVGAHDTRLGDLLAFLGPSLQHLELGCPSITTTVAHGEQQRVVPSK